MVESPAVAVAVAEQVVMRLDIMLIMLTYLDGGPGGGGVAFGATEGSST